MRFTTLLALAWAAPASAERTHDIKPDDYFTLSYLAECRVSPDGKTLAYVEARWRPPKEGRNFDLWLADVASGEKRRVTFDDAYDGSPRWSPDGQFVYFASSRGGNRQVWRLSPGGGLPRQVTRADKSVAAFRLAADGKSVFYQLNREINDGEWKSLRGRFGELEYGHGKRTVGEIHELNLTEWRSQKIAAPGQAIFDFQVSPDGQKIATVTAPDSRLVSYEGLSKVTVFDRRSGKSRVLEDQQWREKARSPFGWIDGLAWHGDSELLAFRVLWDGYPGELFVADAAGGVRKIARPGGVHIYNGRVLWRGDDLCFLYEDRARERLMRLKGVATGGGSPEVLTPGDVVVGDYDFARNGGPFVIMAGPTFDRDVFRRAAGKYRQITAVNPQITDWRLPQISVVNWEGADGDAVAGVLELPPGHDVKKDGPLPTVVYIHGGPTAASPYCYQFSWAGRGVFSPLGYAVLCPNYRGSTGYGDEFMTQLVGRENDIEVKDILTGVDAMVKRGIADPERLAVMGWSNGGFLTGGVITQTQKFKAASHGAGVIDQVMQWGLEDTPGHVVNFMKGLPWQDPKEYRESSPIYGLNKVTTPTLIHVGENDARVPAAHSRALYRGLRKYRKVPTQLIVYPGEPHSLSKYSHRRAKMHWDVEWFKKYLKK